MKKSIFLFFAAILCATSAWAGINGYYIYFEKPSSWTSATTQFMVGHSGWSAGYKMTAIANTSLYQIQMTDAWDDYTEYAFFNTADVWGGEGNTIDNRKSWANHSSSTFKKSTTALKKYHLFNTTKSIKNSTSSYSTAVNRTQTIKVQLKDGSNWVDATVVPADLKASTYALTSATGAGAKSASLAKESTTVSATVSAAYSAKVTLSCTNVLDGYVFEGWYDANGNKITSYTVSDAHTVYARFIQSAEETNEVKVTYMCGTTSVATAVSEFVGVESEKSFTAPTNITGYKFTNWTIGAGITLKTGAATDATIGVVTKSASSDYTLVANYEEVLETVYFINTGKWSDVYLHLWNGNATGTEWPGTQLTATGEKIGDYDVYSYTAKQGDHTNLLFHKKDDDNKKTGDLTWAAGKYYVYNSENSVGTNDWYDESQVEGVLPRYKTIYLNTGGSGLWDQGDAKFFVHAWGGGADDIDAQMKPLENEIYQVEIAASQTGIIFTRQKPESANTALDGNLLWNKTNNRDIPADKNCYTITGWGGDDGTWSNLEYYVAGNKELVGREGWEADGVKMTSSNGTWSHTFNSLEKGIEYQFKITRNGTWDKIWSYQHLSKPIAENILGCKDDNIGFVLANTGDVTITFDGTNISLTTTSSFAAPVYTIVGVEKLTGHDWSVNASDNNMAQDPGNKNIFTLIKEGVTLAAGTYNYKVVRNHTYEWSVPNGSENKTLEITNSGKGTVTFTFDLSKLELTAKNDPWEAEIVAQEVKLHYNDGIVAFTEDDDHKKTFVSIDLAENTVYSFTISINDNHMFNPGIMWRENNEEWKFENATIGQEAHIVTDIAGTHTFTYTYETNKLTVTYPEGTNVPAPVFLGGGMNDWSWTSTRLLPTADGTKASVRVSLTEKTTTEFKIKEGDTMYGNDGTMDRNYHEGWIFSEKKQDSEEAQVNAKIYADITGQYIFTWDYATNTLSVKYPECPTIELDENNNSTILSQYDDKVVNVVLKRSFTANDGYYTLCVPFDMPASVIGKAYQISEVLGCSADGLTVNFTEVTTILAAQPYLIEPATDLDGFTVENVTIDNSTPAAVTVSGAGVTITMQGKYSRDAKTNGLYWIGNDGYLYNDDVWPNALCAYFNITTPSGIAPRMRVATKENTTTGLDNITNSENTTIKVIENGQLIIIRNGEKFNAQGQKL
jgi:hypothetical protein